ncbi:MAG: site-specific integrase [Deltaproteobacteria bacterium]|nr:site-specific integrase [Deltaproteobacteria bacterium]
MSPPEPIKTGPGGLPRILSLAAEKTKEWFCHPDKCPALNSRPTRQTRSEQWMISQQEKSEQYEVVILLDMNVCNELRALQFLSMELARGKRFLEGSYAVGTFVMLRPGELVGGMWEEISLEKAEWYIKADRMKPGFDHVVPLSRQAMELITGLKDFSGNGKFMFPASDRARGDHIVTETLLMAFRRMKYQPGQFTTHGFRAMASTILNGNKTHEIKDFNLPPYDPDLIEIQLSHAENNKIRKAYNRRDPYARIQERREMLQVYADLLDHLRRQFKTHNAV